MATGGKTNIVLGIEAAYGVAPATNAGKLLRRAEFSLKRTSDFYEGNEITGHNQTADLNEGIKKVAGSLKGSLSAGTYSDLFSSLLRRAFATTAAIAGLSLTIGGVPGAYTVTRSVGSFLADGVKLDDIWRITAGPVAPANANINLLITGVTAAFLTVATLNNAPMTLEGPIAACTLSMPGKKAIMAPSAAIEKSFAMERVHTDIGAGASDLYTGIYPTKASLSMPATGNVDCTFDLVGQAVTGTNAPYFVNPGGITTTPVFTAVNGMLRMAGQPVAYCTAASVDIVSERDAVPCISGDTIAEQEAGAMKVTGNLTLKFKNVAQRDAYYNQAELALVLVLTTGKASAADFIVLAMRRIKFTGHDRNDTTKTITETIPFTALINYAGGAGTASDYTTFAMQDSQA